MSRYKNENEIKEEFEKGFDRVPHPYDYSEPDRFYENEHSKNRSVEDTIELYKAVQKLELPKEDFDWYEKNSPFFNNYGEKYAFIDTRIEEHTFSKISYDFEGSITDVDNVSATKKDIEKYTLDKVDDNIVLVNEKKLFDDKINERVFNQLKYDAEIENLCKSKSEFEDYFMILNDEVNKNIQADYINMDAIKDDDIYREISEDLAKEFTQKFKEINDKYYDISKFNFSYSGNSKVNVPELKSDDEIKKDLDSKKDKPLSLKEKFEKQKENIKKAEKESASENVVEKKSGVKHKIR